MINSLSAWNIFQMDKSEWGKILSGCDISESSRAEQLSLEQFGMVYGKARGAGLDGSG